MSDNKKMVRVVDSSVTSEFPERIHDIIVDGEIKRIIFKFGEEKLLPVEQGIKFAALEGFRAFEPGTDTEIMTPPKTDETIRVRIGDDEIIAKYTELTLGALKIRAAALKDGEKFLEEDDKEKIISFLKAQIVEAEEEELEIEMDDEPAPTPAAQIHAGGLEPAPAFVPSSGNAEPNPINAEPNEEDEGDANDETINEGNVNTDPETDGAGDEDKVPTEEGEANPEKEVIVSEGADNPAPESAEADKDKAPVGLPPLPNADNKPSEVETQEYKA